MIPYPTHGSLIRGIYDDIVRIPDCDTSISGV